MSAAHLQKKGIGSGDSSCYIILEGEQDALGAPPTGVGHAHIAGPPPCGPVTAAGKLRRVESTRAKPFWAAISTDITTQPSVSIIGNARNQFYFFVFIYWPRF